MKKKHLIAGLIYLVGFIMYVLFLTLIDAKFGYEAALYSLLSSFGVLLFTSALYIKKEK